MIIYARQGRYYFQDGSISFSLKDSELNFLDGGTEVHFIFERWPPDNSRSKLTKNYLYSNILDRDGNVHGTTFEQIHDSIHRGIDVNNQDQTTDDIIVRFNKVQESTTLSVAGEIDDRTLTLTDVTGAGAGKYIVLFHPSSERFTPFFQVGEAVGDVITIDGPLDFDYPIGTFVDIADTNMAVDGSQTPQIFGLRGTGAPPGVDIDFHMTRIMISCLTATAVDLSKFGDLDALVNGLQFRSRNNRFKNSFNVKTNREIDAIFGTDWKAYASTNPVQGQDGFTARLTYAGMEKIGVAKELPIGTDFESIVQDNLLVAQSASRQITLLEIIAEGHITEP
jgi:hypothetical protein